MEKKHTSNIAQQANKETSSKPAINDVLEGTPFNVVNFPEKGWCLALGNQFITDFTATIEETLNRLETDKWFIIMRISSVIHQRIAQEAVKTMEETIKEHNSHFNNNP